MSTNSWLSDRKIVWILLAVAAGAVLAFMLQSWLREPEAGAAPLPPTGPYQFVVEIEGIPTTGPVRYVDGLDSEVEVLEFQEGGGEIIQKLPGRVRYANIVLRRDFVPLPDDLWNWYADVVGGVENLQRHDGVVSLLDAQGQEAGRYCFYNSWPRAWRGARMVNHSSAGIEEIELVTDRIERC